MAIPENRIRTGAAHATRLVPLIAGIVWLVPAVSWAQKRDPATARVLFQEASRAADTGDYATACPKFADSYRLDPAVGTLLNIADCQQRSGRLATAWVSFQRALEQLPSDDDRRPIVEKLSIELEKRVPRLTLRLATTAPEDTTIERDGAPVVTTTLGIALPLDPGHHVISVKAPGHVERTYEFDLAEGEAKEVVAEPGTVTEPTTQLGLVPVGGGPSRAEAQAGSPAVAGSPALGNARSPSNELAQPQPLTKHGSRTAAYIVGGLGATAIVGGIVTRVLALGQKSVIKAHCDSDKLCDPTGIDAVSRADTYQTLSTVSLLLGAAGLGVGIYLGFAEAENPATRAKGQLLVLPNGVALSVQRSF